MTARVEARGFTVRDLDVGPRDRTTFGAFTIPAGIPDLPPVFTGSRCYFAPPRAFGALAAAALDAAPDAVRWDGMVAATDPATGAELHALRFPPRPPGDPSAPSRVHVPDPACLVPGTTLAPRAALAWGRGALPPEWFPGFDANGAPWRVVPSGEPRVYCAEGGALAFLPRDPAAASAFVVAGDDAANPPHTRALRAEFRGPIGGAAAALARVWRAVFTIGAVTFEGCPSHGASSPGFAAGWHTLAEVLAARSPLAGLVFVEQGTPDPAARRDPTPGTMLSVLYFDATGPDAPALYSVAAPFASYRAGAVVATGRRSIA